MPTAKKIVLGITGSIAAYKSVHLVRLMIKKGYEVKVLMTPSAKDFVSPLTLSTLSRNEVLADLATEKNWNNHVMLGRWADLVLIAPLSCNTLSKMVSGACDNILLAVYLSATCPVVVAPAMDEDMWKHPATKENLEKLAGYGNKIIPVGNGELASGLVGEGRMAEPEQIMEWVEQHFFSAPADLKNKKVLVTAGPTYEALDPVRFIGNHSSGKMGIAIARELQRRGATVTLVLGPVSQTGSLDGLIVKKVVSASEMFDACNAVFDNVDLAIMAAAVADYTPVQKAEEKIKKSEENFSIGLTRTKDILKSLGEKKKTGQVLVGFALETNNEKANALDKLSRKNADMIILNSLRDDGAGFSHDTNKITIFKSNGEEKQYPVKSKEEVAKDIVANIIETYYA